MLHRMNGLKAMYKNHRRTSDSTLSVIVGFDVIYIMTNDGGWTWEFAGRKNGRFQTALMAYHHAVKDAHNRLIKDACDAEIESSLDELEAYAEKIR